MREMPSYRLIEKQLLYAGKKVRLEVHHLQEEESDTRIVKEVVEHPGAVVVLPFIDANTIALIRNRRYAIHEVLLELPAGTLNRNEDPINCAGRELLEETGYLAKRLKSLTNFFTSPGILTERMYAFSAHELVKSQQALEPGEDIEVVPTPFDKAVQMIATGEIKDGKTIATLLLYERFVRGHLP